MHHALTCRVCRALRLRIGTRLIDAMFCAIVNSNYTPDEWAELVTLATQMDCDC
jgi:hypothetical protein